MARFTADTHLFRELGELLVGRDSTALTELIKNAYDADATEVTVHGEQLDDPSRGRILVTDNGIGMNADEFENGFLRIASRLKDQGERRSILFQRRYTGAKGIGRLAAHKLSRQLEVESVRREQTLAGSRESVYAALDWDKIEECETLDELDSTDAIVLENGTARNNAHSGTTLILSRLRRAWTPDERARFFAEVQSFSPPAFLYEPLPSFVIPKSLLFPTPVMRDQGSGAAGAQFAVHLEGEFATGEDYWKLFAEMANWVLEIRADPSSEQVHFAIAPTKKTLRNTPGAQELFQSIRHPTPHGGPYFDARILVREGKRNLTSDQRVWDTNASGVRVYLEGFRVLPYGDRKDDWLSIDADYTKRPRQLETLKQFELDTEASDPDSGLVRVPSNNYYGAVFLTQEGSPDMRLLVNREGFVQEAGFETLERLVRLGIDFLTRERAGASFESRQQRKAERGRRSNEAAPPSFDEASDVASESVEAPGLPERIRQAAHLIRQAGASLTGDAKYATNAAVEKLEQATPLVEDLISERTLLFILASVGTQMAAFVHEINALLAAAQTIEQALGEVLEHELALDARR